LEVASDEEIHGSAFVRGEHIDIRTETLGTARIFQQPKVLPVSDRGLVLLFRHTHACGRTSPRRVPLCEDRSSQRSGPSCYYNTWCVACGRVRVHQQVLPSTMDGYSARACALRSIVDCLHTADHRTSTYASSPCIHLCVSLGRMHYSKKYTIPKTILSISTTISKTQVQLRIKS
jgi:hypothetical protein